MKSNRIEPQLNFTLHRIIINSGFLENVYERPHWIDAEKNPRRRKLKKNMQRRYHQNCACANRFF